MKFNTDAVSTARPLTPGLADAMFTPADYTILIVDDQEETRLSTRLLLESEGYRVLTATTGAEALRQVQSGPVDLIIMDYLMPRMNGKQLTQELRKHHPNVQILLQTGYSGEGNLSDLIHALNIQGYHNKIDGPDRLLLWIKALFKSAERTPSLSREQFVCEVSAQIPPITTDPNKLLVIIYHLLEYAATGTSHGKLRLSLYCSPTEEGLVIEIQATSREDTAEAEAVITSFSQVAGSLPSSAYGKASHGLAVACYLTSQLGGKLSVAHTAGAGVTFTVTLPIASDSSEINVTPSLR